MQAKGKFEISFRKCATAKRRIAMGEVISSKDANVKVKFSFPHTSIFNSKFNASILKFILRSSKVSHVLISPCRDKQSHPRTSIHVPQARVKSKMKCTMAAKFIYCFDLVQSRIYNTGKSDFTNKFLYP